MYGNVSHTSFLFFDFWLIRLNTEATERSVRRDFPETHRWRNKAADMRHGEANGLFTTRSDTATTCQTRKTDPSKKHFIDTAGGQEEDRSARLEEMFVKTSEGHLYKDFG